MVFPLGCYGVTCWWTACRVFRVILLCRFQRWYLFKFRRWVVDSKRGEVFVRSDQKRFRSDLLCDLIQSVTSIEAICTRAHYSLVATRAWTNGSRNAWVLQYAVLRQLIVSVWKIWTSLNSRLSGYHWTRPSRIVDQHVSKSTYGKWKFVLKWWLL